MTRPGSEAAAAAKTGAVVSAAARAEAGGWRIVDDPGQWILQRRPARGRVGGSPICRQRVPRYFCTYREIVERCLHEDGVDADVIAELVAPLPDYHRSRPGPLPARPRVKFTEWPCPPLQSAAPARHKQASHVSGVVGTIAPTAVSGDVGA